MFHRLLISCHLAADRGVVPWPERGVQSKISAKYRWRNWRSARAPDLNSSQLSEEKRNIDDFNNSADRSAPLTRSKSLTVSCSVSAAWR